MVDQAQIEQFTDTEARPLAQDRSQLMPRSGPLDAREEIPYGYFRRMLLTPQDASTLLAPVRGGPCPGRREDEER